MPFCAVAVDVGTASGSESDPRSSARGVSRANAEPAAFFAPEDHTGALGTDEDELANGDDCPENAENAEACLACVHGVESTRFGR